MVIRYKIPPKTMRTIDLHELWWYLELMRGSFETLDINEASSQCKEYLDYLINDWIDSAYNLTQSF